MDNSAFVPQELALRHRNRNGVELLNSSTPLIYNNINLSALFKPGALFEPPLALSILRGALACHNGMATFAEAGVDSA